ncbi:uncharacterized protein N7511_005813 [Penicillium nucicola]|uniref:uncharacterized protein n=1 Tax=Penicillium nucicola TaxID=1850975 RepID=UPI0025457797|nr:uncharacterized protein N7511_005813 [Penicillium nucicola]KAJ5762431.1 hypothetical protein N7511_005813 [Penicillium nucicola]
MDDLYFNADKCRWREIIRPRGINHWRVRGVALESKKPCDNCTTANKECVSSEPVTQRARVSAKYARALEERIIDLESQVGQREHITPVIRQETAPDTSRPRNDGLWSNKRTFERAISENESDIDSRTSRRRLHDDSSQHGSSSNPQVAQVPSVSTTPNQTQPLPESNSRDALPDAQGQCGHPSLLIGIIATLAKSGSCISPHTETPTTSISSPFITQISQSDRPLSLSKEISDRLVQIYLERVNPRYPFLHLDTFLSWYESWKAQSHLNRARRHHGLWKDYFVTMVHAVALLLTPRVSESDIASSQSLYNTAMEYLGYVFAEPDPILHAQAYLLLTLHALHSPSSQMIITMISATMRYCVMAQLHLAESEPKGPNPAFSLEVQTRRRVFWSAYALDRLISWIYHIPNNIIDEHISVELFSNVGDADLHRDSSDDSRIRIETPSQKTHVSPALHLFRCRRIQSRILSTLLRSDFEEINASTTWREHMLGELDTWRSQLRLLSDVASKSYTSDRWVGMAYNYTILLLHQPTKENVCNGFGDRSVPACVQIAMTFRTFQKDRQTAQLWPGLLSQVAVGITLLYCFWATPPQHQTPAYKSREVPEALRACSTALAILAERWIQAEPLRDVFDTLAREIPVCGLVVDDLPRRISGEAASYVQSQIPLLASIIMHRGVMRMIHEIVTEDFPGGFADPHHPVLSAGLGDHLCSIECPFFRGSGHAATLAVDFPGFDSFEDGIGGGFGVDDETLMFPLLFWVC